MHAYSMHMPATSLHNCCLLLKATTAAPSIYEECCAKVWICRVHVEGCMLLDYAYLIAVPSTHSHHCGVQNSASLICAQGLRHVGSADMELLYRSAVIAVTCWRTTSEQHNRQINTSSL